jgi:hypothetical protein
MSAYFYSDVIKILSPLFRSDFWCAFVVVFLKHISAHVHPISNNIDGHIASQKMCDAASPNRVRIDCVTTLLIRILLTTRAFLVDKAR